MGGGGSPAPDPLRGLGMTWCGAAFSVGEYEDRAAGFETAIYDPGMVTNYENLFTVLNDDPGWKGGTGGGFIETILMTDSGLEVLSGLGRNVSVVG